jgi:hypothetical protein
MCILNPLLRTFRLFKREIYSYLLFWGTVLAFRDPDPDWDPLTQLNPDPKYWVFVKQNHWLTYLFQLSVALKVLKAVIIHF